MSQRFRLPKKKQEIKKAIQRKKRRRHHTSGAPSLEELLVAEHSVNPTTIKKLQTTIGNQAVLRMLADQDEKRKSSPTLTIQRKKQVRQAAASAIGSYGRQWGHAFHEAPRSPELAQRVYKHWLMREEDLVHATQHLKKGAVYEKKYRQKGRPSELQLAREEYDQARNDLRITSVLGNERRISREMLLMLRTMRKRFYPAPLALSALPAKLDSVIHRYWNHNMAREQALRPALQTQGYDDPGDVKLKVTQFRRDVQVIARLLQRYKDKNTGR